jgi:hypothetical protein
MTTAMSAAAKDLDLSVLPPDYRAAFEALQAQAARAAELEEVVKCLEHLVAELNHVVHVKKSEKLHADDRQLAFEDLEIAVAEAREQKQIQTPGEDTSERKRVARRNRGNLPAELPRMERVVDPESLDCPCGCGQMHRIGEDRSERLDIVPAQLRVIVTVRSKCACRTCSEGVTQAPAPSWLIAGGLPTEGTITHVLVSKYADHCPLL